MKKVWKALCTIVIGLCLVFVASCNLKVSFELNFIVDDEIYSTVETNGNEIISMPQDPTKENYTFDGWYWDKDIWKNEFTARSLLDTPLSSNMEVYAHFVDDSYLFGTNIRVKTAEKVAVEGVGDVFYLVQRNNQLVCKLEDYVECNPKTTWTLSKDLSGNNPITSKTIELSLGDNPLYYIYVTDKDQRHDTYILLIHRNNMYTVTFNANGGSSCDSQKIEEGYKLQNIPTSSREGYAFGGWDYDFDNPIKSNVVANAIWTANQYTVSFDVNGGSPLDSNKLKVTYDSSFVLPTPSRLGYRFAGWYQGTTRIYDGKWTYAGNMTLTAHWDIVTYSISYYLDGGIRTTYFHETYTVEDEFTLPSPYRTGYNFIGWSTSQNGSGIVNYKINKGTTGDLSFFAKWQAKEYTVTYDVNGGDPLENDNQTVTYGSDYELANPTRFGYSFAGWYDGYNKVNNNGVWYTDGDTLLRANWALETYDIVYHLNGGIAPVQYPSTYTVNDLGSDDKDSVLLNNMPTKTGYSLDGLFDDSDFTKSYTTLSEQTWVGNKDVYFKWNPNKYTITFNVNGGNSLDNGTIDVYYGNSYVLPIPTRSGYSFQGWYNNSEKVIDGTWTRLDDLSLTAKWSIETYKITYELDDGINSINNPSVFNYEDETIVLEEATKTGYTFLGWTSDGVETPTKNYVISHNSTGDLTIFANWQVNTYTITFDANGGGGLTSESVQVDYDSNVELPVLTKIGYTFAGWFNQTTKYESGAWSVASDITLTAQWTVLNYRINYELDGGTNNPSNPSSYTYDSDDIVLGDPSKTGYTFLGWTSLEISTPTKSVAIPNHSLGEKEFTANWKVNTYAITYDVNGGNALSSNVQTVVYGDDYSLKETSRAGYTFAGWFNGGNLFDSGTWFFTEDVLLVAKWNVNSYSISYEMNEGTNDPNNPSSYTYGSGDVVLSEPSKTGYEFLGWTSTSIVVPSKEVTISNNSLGDVAFTANWRANTYTVSLDVNGGEVLQNDSLTITYDSSYELPVPERNGYTFLGWCYGDTEVDQNGVWKLVGNIELKAKWTYGFFEDNVRYCYFGKFPQTRITDSTLIGNLNNLPETNEDGYYEYNGEEYCKNVAQIAYVYHGSSWSYRNVYFDDGTKVENGTTYWFKVEPIKWRNIGNSLDSYSFVSDKILVTYKLGSGSGYYTSYSGRKFTTSLASEYLTGDFYDSVFSDAEKAKMVDVVDSKKINVMSYPEIESIWATRDERKAYATDYCKTTGGFYDNYYWLDDDQNRYYEGSRINYFVSGDGNILNSYSFSEKYENKGLRPVIRIV